MTIWPPAVVGGNHWALSSWSQPGGLGICAGQCWLVGATSGIHSKCCARL